MKNYKVDNNEINSWKRKLFTRLFLDYGMKVPQTQRKKFNAYNKSLSLNAFQSKDAFGGRPVALLSAPIIPMWETDQKYDGNTKLNLASQFFYSSLERRLKNFVNSEDSQYLSMIVLDYNDFKKYKTYKRKPSRGKARIYNGAECLIELAKIYLINRGLEVIIYNLPNETFAKYQTAEYKKLMRSSVDIQQKQLKGDNVIFTPEVIEDDSIACILGVIGSGKENSFTFTVGNFPQYMLDFDDQELKEELRSRGLDFDKDGIDFSKSPFARYFMTKVNGNDYMIPFRLNEDILEDKGLEKEYGAEANNVLAGIRPSMSLYRYIENNILNDLDILQSLEMFQYTNEKGKMLKKPLLKEETPFLSTKREWDAYHEKNKAHKRVKEFDKKRSRTLRDEYKQENKIFDRDLITFDSLSISYIRDLSRMMKNLNNSVEDGTTFVKLRKDQQEEIANIISSFKVSNRKSSDDYISPSESARLFLLMKNLDELTDDEGSSEDLIEVMPFETKIAYLKKKREFLEALGTALDELEGDITTATSKLVGGRLSDLSTWQLQEAKTLEDQEARIDKGIRDFEKIVDEVFTRRVENFEIPKPPKGYEPRLSLFAITNDGSCFKIARVRGKIKKVNEYPFYLAGDALNPLNIMIGALLEPSSAGTKLAEIAISSIGINHPTVRTINAMMKNGANKDAEALAQRFLAAVMDKQNRKKAARLISTGTRLEQIQTAISNFGGRFRRIYDDQKKDFYTNTPSLQRYLDSYLKELLDKGIEESKYIVSTCGCKGFIKK